MRNCDRKYRLLLVLVGLLSGFCNPLIAQQKAQFTDYMYNTMRFNPAYAGARGHLSVLAIYRNQWVGMTGAPTTFNVSAHAPVGRRKRVGLGLEFISDHIGPSAQQTVAANFSYLIPITENVFFSFGLKAGVSAFAIDPEKLQIYDRSGTNLQQLNSTSAVLGVGAYLYGDRWYLGLSSPNFLTTKMYDAAEISTVTSQSHFYLLGGYVFSLSPEIDFKPIVLVKAVSGAPIAIDWSVNAVFKNKFTLGIAYRRNSAVSALVAFQLNAHILIGYAYDYSLSPIAHYNQGSHEIFLRFELL